MKPERLSNREIASALRETGLYYEMEGVPYKPAAYERAADSVDAHDASAAELHAAGGRGALKRIPGVGDAIARHIAQMLTRGDFPEHAAFKKRYPVDLLGLTAIDRIGPKTVKTLYRELGVRTVADLERAVKKGRIGKLAHFGKTSERGIARGIKRARTESGRKLLGAILPMAERMAEELRNAPGVDRAEIAGSVRRRQETIGDLDFIATAAKPADAVAAFLGLPEVSEMIERGETMASAFLRNGMRADVRVATDDSFGAVLQHFTGSREHNIALRKIAIAKGYKLNEYGMWRRKKRVASRTEEEVYGKLGLDLMPPEIRTDAGEIEAAAKGTLPSLIPYGSVRGDLQVQTDWTEGHASIEAMAAEAVRLGREYIAITDHTRDLAMVRGLDERRLARQGREIDRLNARIAKKTRSGFFILKGAEVNIRKDGSLDIADAALAKLDVVGASVHSYFHLDRSAQTKRIIAAIRNPHVDVLFHPSGRLIGRREPYDVDMEAVLKEAKRTGTAVEIDAYPDRMDLKDTHVRMAVALGVKLVIDTDAHKESHLGYLELGTAIARRGWATKKDVLNTRPLKDVLAWFRSPKQKR